MDTARAPSRTVAVAGRPRRSRWPFTAILAVAVLGLVCISTPSPDPSLAAYSAPAIHIRGTGIGHVFLRPTPDTTRPALGSIPDGESPDYHCYTHGQTVGPTSVWFRVTYAGVTGYYSANYDDAHFTSETELTRVYGIPACEATRAVPPPGPTGPEMSVDPAESTSGWDTAWRVAKCGASLSLYPVVAARLFKVVKGAASIAELATLLVRGALTVAAVEAVAGGILGVQDVINNCVPLM
jgi:hypothetical protein